MTVSAISYKFRIGEIPIPTRYHNRASSIGGVRGVKFVLDSLGVVAAYKLVQLGILKDRRFKFKKKR